MNRTNKHPLATGICLLLLAAQVAVAETGPSANAAGFEAALRATLTRHPAIRGKQAEVDAKHFTGDSARAERYPTLSAELGLMDDDAEETALRARQPLWAFNRIDSAIAYADADVMAEQADLLRVRRRLLEETAVAYTKVLDVHWRLRISADDIASHERLFKQIDRRAKGQLASETDVRLASARLVQSRARKARMDGELRVALAELEALTQIPIAAGRMVSPRFTRLPGLDMIEATALRESADIRFKALLLDMSRADVERQRTSYMPTVYLQAEHTHTTDPAYTSDDDTRVGIVLEGSFDGMGFVSKGRHRAAGARLEAARKDLESTRDELVRHVRTLIANRQVHSELAGVLDASVKELQATLDSYERQYEAGHKAWLDVLNIQRELTEQRLQEAQAENEYLLYSLRIAALIGALDRP